MAKNYHFVGGLDCPGYRADLGLWHGMLCEHFEDGPRQLAFDSHLARTGLCANTCGLPHLWYCEFRTPSVLLRKANRWLPMCDQLRDGEEETAISN